MTLFWVFSGLTFGVAAGLSAFLITYREYQQHKIEPRAVIRHALSSALFAFLFFFVSALAIGIAISPSI